ncbi:P-loop containing nucleoside triphosphate hydrolase protein [Pseudomassariella vexata]|uniref:p-loop containing nucleoside triphosphate hydrolase protein n=1 Tax=Pseudomassariella vexata TaxID=1141098 RepID=A0A1Y2DDT3_9PEZI|nr:P-loop containing nucleoside triphosphate hydrolase protein [Pseudomassariella vexata]ORY57442.1 P-loop containing nucleoside triphosphate hydrolase protein [Pseudomassariella vexata]
MEPIYTSLTDRARNLQQNTERNNSSESQNVPWRAVIALAGPPGSGKSTIAAEVVHRLNAGRVTPAAAVVPMDGFHYSRATLDSFPNAAEAYARRGAAWTFDSAGVVALFKALDAGKMIPREEAPVVRAPSFDHALKDPVADDITIPSSVTLVILEGNWLLYDEDPWRKIAGMVDETWFVDVDRDIARNRVARRHIRSGIETTWNDALARAEDNDIPNGDDVRRTLIKPHVTVKSVEEKSFERDDELIGNNTAAVPVVSSVNRVGS